MDNQNSKKPKLSNPAIGQYKEGDHQAFANIYSEYRQRLIYILQAHNAKDAEDTAEDVFSRLCEEEAKAAIRTDRSLFNFICTVALNINRNKRAHEDVEKKYCRKVSAQANAEQISYSPEDEYIVRGFLQQLYLVIKKKLTDKQREVFYRWMQGSSYKEIAQQLGIKESTARTHIHRIIKILRKLVGC